MYESLVDQALVDHPCGCGLGLACRAAVMTGWRRLPFNQRMLFLVLWFCPGLLLLHCGINLALTKQRMSVAGGLGCRALLVSYQCWCVAAA